MIAQQQVHYVKHNWVYSITTARERHQMVHTLALLCSVLHVSGPMAGKRTGIQLRHLVVTLWRKMHEVLFTQAMTDGTKITSVWDSQKSKKTVWN